MTEKDPFTDVHTSPDAAGHAAGNIPHKKDKAVMTKESHVNRVGLAAGALLDRHSVTVTRLTTP